MFYRSTHILLIILLAMSYAGYGKCAYAQSSLTKQELGIADDEIWALHEDIARWKSEVEKIEERAKRYEDMAEDARKQAEESTHKADKNHWLENADQRMQRAKNLHDDATKLLEKVDAAENKIADLKDTLSAKKETVQQEEARWAEQQKETAQNNSASDESKNPRFTREMLFESWEIDIRHKGDDPGVFVIAPENPRSEEYKYSLVLATVEREWKGRFYGPNELDTPEGLASFTYKPNADEMNPDIPAWARKKIEGELEWKLVLEQDGTYGTPRLITKFYPGKIEWEESDEAQTASVTGEGEPRTYIYSPIIDDIHAFTYGTPEVDIRMKGADKNETRPIEGIIKLQPFFVDVFLTPEMAAKAGKTLMLDIKGEKGSSTSIKLISGAKNTNGMTIYTHYDPVAIANRGDTRIDDYTPMTGSVDWMMGKVLDNDDYHPGTRLPINIENGEMVSFSYDGSSYTVPVFDTWVQRGIARHVHAMQTLYGFYSFIKDGYPPASQFAKDEAAAKLQMMDNYKAIMESEEVHDHIRYAVGEKYFGAADAQGSYMDVRMLMPTYNQMDSVDIYRSTLGENPTKKEIELERKKAAAFKKNTIAGLVGRSRWYFNNKAERGGLNYYDHYDVITPLTEQTRKGEIHESGYFDGVLWTHPLEKALIESAAFAANEDLAEEMYHDLPIAMAYAMYSGIASASNMDGLYTYVFGENIMGQKVQQWEKRTAGLGFLFGTILTFALPHIDMEMPSFNNSLKLTGSARGQRLKAQARTKEVKMLNESSARKIQDAKSILKGFSSERIAAMKLNFETNAPRNFNGWNKPIRCVKSKSGTIKVKPIKTEKGSVIPYEFRDPGTRGNVVDATVTPPRSGMATPPPRPEAFVPAETVNVTKGAKLADDVKPHEFQEGLKWYGKIEEMGPKLAKPQEGQICECEFLRRDIEDLLGRSISSIDLVSRAAKYTKHDVAYLMEDGIPTEALVAVARELGFPTVLYNDANVRLMHMEAYDYLLQQGMIVRLAVEPMGQVGEVFAHAIRLRRFGRNADGDIETITFFDPAFGRDITMTIANFKRIVAKDRAPILLHPTKTINDVDLQMGMAKQVSTAEARKGGVSYEERMKQLFPERHTANDNSPSAKKLDETWHDGNVLPANDNTPVKALDETWADGELPIPTAKIDPATLEGNPVVKVKSKKALDETWVDEDFEVPPATTAIEKSVSDVGTTKDPSSVVESLDPKGKRATNINTPPNEDGDD